MKALIGWALLAVAVVADKVIERRQIDAAIKHFTKSL